MQIVIDIPIMTLLNITSRELLLCSRKDIEKLEFAIKNGTPLPEGHGRLIDADALGEKLHRYTEAPYQYALTVFNESLTIIEADGGDV